jgi:hypothetical protein
MTGFLTVVVLVTLGAEVLGKSESEPKPAIASLKALLMVIGLRT